MPSAFCWQWHGTSFLPLSGERRRYAVCHGAAALSYADVQGHLPPYVGEGGAVSPQDGRHHYGGSIVIWALGYYPDHDAYETVAEQQENSYIGQIGKAMEPVIEPLGFDWKLGIGILSGVGAKELVVSTLGVLYTNDAEADAVSLAERIPITPLVAFCYMVFVLIYFPCIATIVAIKQESGSWKWALFTAVYTTLLAWVMAFAIYRIGGLFV